MAERGKIDDLATLDKLDEAILLEELKSRYTKDKIYVSFGTMSIISYCELCWQEFLHLTDLPGRRSCYSESLQTAANI